MANTQTIQKFYTTAAQRDFARVFQFRLNSFGNVDFGPEQLTYVETASLPGRTITNVPVPYMGLDFNVPGTVKYPGSAGYAVTLRCDQNYDLRSALEAATFNTFDEANSTGQYSIPGAGINLTMELLDKQMNPIRYYTLFGVYIQALADAAYDIKDSGTVQTIQATLAYQFWRSGKITPVPLNSNYSRATPNWIGRANR
jgi:hypothetical protein